MVLLWATLFNLRIICAAKAITVDILETTGKRQQILQIANKITCIGKQDNSQYISLTCLPCRSSQRWTAKNKKNEGDRQTIDKNKGFQIFF